MLSLCLCSLLAATPEPPVELRAGPIESEDTVGLDVAGLVAPARAEAGLYLFGRLSTSAYSLRALLLRSTDGGVRWTEVLPEKEHSEVLFVEFESCEGRALVGWSMEGPGELTLYASSGCGATWKLQSTLPKAGPGAPRRNRPSSLQPSPRSPGSRPRTPRAYAGRSPLTSR